MQRKVSNFKFQIGLPTNPCPVVKLISYWLRNRLFIVTRFYSFFYSVATLQYKNRFSSKWCFKDGFQSSFVSTLVSLAPTVYVGRDTLLLIKGYATLNRSCFRERSLWSWTKTSWCWGVTLFNEHTVHPLYLKINCHRISDIGEWCSSGLVSWRWVV